MSAGATKGPAVIGDTAFVATATSAGRAANDEGVDHYQEKRWSEAEQQFKKAVATDAKLAEAHYNLGLTLDKLGDHEGAAASFKKVAQLAPAHSPMRQSIILKEHIGQ
jgi:Flp pilus assembly protein TadD